MANLIYPAEISALITIMVNQKNITFKFSTTLLHTITEEAFRSLVDQVMLRIGDNTAVKKLAK